MKEKKARVGQYKITFLVGNAEYDVIIVNITFQFALQQVWPNVEMKSSPHFSKSCQKLWTAVFTLLWNWIDVLKDQKRIKRGWGWPAIAQKSPYIWTFTNMFQTCIKIYLKPVETRLLNKQTFFNSKWLLSFSETYWFTYVY